jgi:hypothetical protein
MRIVRWERIGDRRIRLVALPEGAYAVTIETIGPDGAWVDISLQADARLRVAEAERRYVRRLEEVRFRGTSSYAKPIS